MSDNGEESDSSSPASSETSIRHHEPGFPMSAEDAVRASYDWIHGENDRFRYDEAWIAFGLMHAHRYGEAFVAMVTEEAFLAANGLIRAPSTVAEGQSSRGLPLSYSNTQPRNETCMRSSSIRSNVAPP
jgi:hypothetical protein